jgi:hypothetical protein
MFLYPWHFHPRHLQFKGDKYVFDYSPGKEQKYHDNEGKEFVFPPPNNNVKDFIHDVLKPKTPPRDRWAQSDMPAWLWEMLNIDDKLRIDDDKSPRKQRAKEEAELSPYMKRRMQSSEARIHCLSNRLKNTTKNSDAVLSNVNERHEKQKAAMEKKHEAMLLEMKQQYEKRMKDKEDELEEAKAVIRKHVETITKLEGIIEGLEEEDKAKATLLKQLREGIARPFKYLDLYEGGMLSSHVKNFTFFNTIRQNEKFLDALSYTDGSEGSFPEGDGLCENLRAPNDVDWE